MSETLLFAEHEEDMLCTKIVLNVRNNFCTQHVLPKFELGIFLYWTCNSMNNLSSYFGLLYAKIRASDKNLSVLRSHQNWINSGGPVRLLITIIVHFNNHCHSVHREFFFASRKKIWKITDRFRNGLREKILGQPFLINKHMKLIFC